MQRTFLHWDAKLNVTELCISLKTTENESLNFYIKTQRTLPFLNLSFIIICFTLLAINIYTANAHCPYLVMYVTRQCTFYIMYTTHAQILVVLYILPATQTQAFRTHHSSITVKAAHHQNKNNKEYCFLLHCY